MVVVLCFRFLYVPCPHTSEVLSQVLVDTIIEWNIDTKLSTITLDNCSTNDALIDVVKDKLSCENMMWNGSKLHMRCCAHILNLIVKDGLDVIKKSIDRIRDSVSFWTATPKRQEKFEESVKHLRISYGNLMLHSAIMYKDVFPRLKIRDPLYKSLPSESDWGFAKKCCSKLELFYDITELFSGMASNMLFKFDKYWSMNASSEDAGTELDSYLFAKVLPRTEDFDVLLWWKANALTYPTLAMIARDVLAVPVTTVASESAFSSGGRLVSPSRSRLHSDTVEALMCAQNWLQKSSMTGKLLSYANILLIYSYFTVILLVLSIIVDELGQLKERSLHTVHEDEDDDLACITGNW
ncbi:Putative AC9 transposase [Linum perenne]